MKRWLALLLLLSACTAQPPTPVTSAPAPAQACRTAPDGGPPLADRGIGGTGSPQVQTAERGIGGTGIVGVITGFGSVCLAGEKVPVPPGLTPAIDGQPAAPADLRAGQYAAVAVGATGDAQRIDVRHLVIGPVQPSTLQGTMMVAGQTVQTASAVGEGAGAAVGQWVAVSGLRAPDGSIAATRIDMAPPGRVLVHGVLQRTGGTVRIGALAVRLPAAALPAFGTPVTVTGALVRGVLVADRVTSDPAAANPAAFFGPEVTTFVVEGYAAAVAGGVLLDQAFIAGEAFGPPGETGRRITVFRRGEGGGFFAAPRAEGFAPARLPEGQFGLPGQGGPAGAGGGFVGRPAFQPGGLPGAPSGSPFGGPPGGLGRRP